LPQRRREAIAGPQELALVVKNRSLALVSSFVWWSSPCLAGPGFRYNLFACITSIVVSFASFCEGTFGRFATELLELLRTPSFR
jgi:hypothetical protein